MGGDRLQESSHRALFLQKRLTRPQSSSLHARGGSKGQLPPSHHTPCATKEIERDDWGRARRRGPGTSTLWRKFIAYNFQVTPCVGPYCLLKFFVYSRQQSAHSEQRDQRMRQVVGYKRLKTIENQKTFRPKKLSRSLTGGGRLLDVPTVRL